MEKGKRQITRLSHIWDLVYTRNNQLSITSMEVLDLDQCTHEVRAQYWKRIILTCQQRPAGVSASRWLKENGITEQSYYKWQQKFRRETFEIIQPQDKKLPLTKDEGISFAEIPVKQTLGENCFESPTAPVAVIKTPAITVVISNEISDSLLSRIIREVSANA